MVVLASDENMVVEHGLQAALALYMTYGKTREATLRRSEYREAVEELNAYWSEVPFAEKVAYFQNIPGCVRLVLTLRNPSMFYIYN